ncbi:hypothetical protein P170DRAFT_51650 [Aspergillus steynii IBT 23096]|uniref:CBM21 domain-containing protein n=1 Tax=Aspergillus steynii IBT 23096 TaxID=1392250 RepID=A0A2I2GSK3_9EURO|nr:uncharacterized protein P170DRAFT_51650 [Aspergillus steynii IBT 23096]PLB55862.1 hypothetical protein P170DRAFT_51650 [Aspergillus steynii IBT 23096]
MPYTAPLKSTLSAQHIEYSDPISQSCPSSPTLAGPQEGRPHLSRFYNSTSYLRKHRRSSSNSKNSIDKPFKVHHAFDPHGSVRQSPPPVSEALMPPGAIISPPESAPNSSDEEAPYKHRDGPRLEELEAAVRSIEQRRVSSPERQPNEMPSSSVTPTLNAPKPPTRPPLSKEARKISHSRSFTENAIAHRQEESALTSSPEESDRDDEPQPKHPMVRKKSGELVRPALRPASARRRPSSMPGTPTYSKAVHFDSQLEHIRHFLQLDKPQAVSTGTSPVEDFEAQREFPFKKEGSSDGSSLEWGLHLTNFPKDTAARSQQRVRLERLSLSSDKSTLIGVVAAANLAFEKHVASRFTFDHWKTVSEVHAEYDQGANRNQKYDGFDRFSFSIKLNDQANLERKTMFICIRYSVKGCEYWDNNQSRNFQVNFLKIPKAKPSPPSPQPAPTVASRPTLPRSRTFTHSGVRPQSVPSAFDDFSSLNDSLSFGRPSKESKSVTLCEDPSHDLEAPPPIRREKQSHQMFGNRYDFEASLSAVMRTKPELDRTTLTARAKSGRSATHGEKQYQPKGRGADSQKDMSVGEKKPQSGHREESKPSTLAFGKPHRESSTYKELVDRYCFFGSSNSNDSGPSGSENDEPGARKDSTDSSNPPSPKSSPLPSPLMDVTKISGRSSSSSPKPFAYNHHQPVQNRFLQETHTPTAIRG